MQVCFSLRKYEQPWKQMLSVQILIRSLYDIYSIFLNYLAFDTLFVHLMCTPYSEYSLSKWRMTNDNFTLFYWNGLRPYLNPNILLNLIFVTLLTTVLHIIDKRTTKSKFSGIFWLLVIIKLINAASLTYF